MKLIFQRGALTEDVRALEDVRGPKWDRHSECIEIIHRGRNHIDLGWEERAICDNLLLQRPSADHRENQLQRENVRGDPAE